MTIRARTTLTATAAALGIITGPLATGALADVCTIDPDTGECAGTPIDDGTFFPDSTFMPGANYFPDSAFDAYNPDSDDITFPDSTYMPSCDGDTFVMPGDNVHSCPASFVLMKDGKW